MKKVIFKGFFIWNYEKEERWLNEMAAKGLVLTSVGLLHYVFEDCIPGEYKICMEFLGKGIHNTKNENYIQFLKDTGVEHIDMLKGWAYFRTKQQEEDFKLFSDNHSLIAHLTKIIRFVALVLGLNLFVGLLNLFWFLCCDSDINSLGIINLVLAILCAKGLLNLYKQRKNLRKEQRIYE